MPQGSIPAWAGKPRGRSTRRSSLPVYPRVGGETGIDYLPAHVFGGLSPRGRGNLGVIAWRISRNGSIPAWAGKPRVRRRWRLVMRVYPRVGGETDVCTLPQTAWAGLSPRGRGNHLRDRRKQLADGSIPAWAGKPTGSCCHCYSSGVYPRVGGETRGSLRWLTRLPGLSPRGRGNLLDDVGSIPFLRSIPAWAGKPLCHNDPVSQENEYVKDRWTYGDSPAIRRIRRHTSCASGSARWRGAAVKIDSTSQAVASEV